LVLISLGWNQEASKDVATVSAMGAAMQTPDVTPPAVKAAGAAAEQLEPAITMYHLAAVMATAPERATVRL